MLIIPRKDVEIFQWHKNLIVILLTQNFAGFVARVEKVCQCRLVEI